MSVTEVFEEEETAIDVLCGFLQTVRVKIHRKKKHASFTVCWLIFQCTYYDEHDISKSYRILNTVSLRRALTKEFEDKICYFSLDKVCLRSFINGQSL